MMDVDASWNKCLEIMEAWVSHYETLGVDLVVVAESLTGDVWAMERADFLLRLDDEGGRLRKVMPDAGHRDQIRQEVSRIPDKQRFWVVISGHEDGFCRAMQFLHPTREEMAEAKRKGGRPESVKALTDVIESLKLPDRRWN